MKFHKPVIFGLAVGLVVACSTMDRRANPPLQPERAAQVPMPVPRHEPLSRYGNPASYEVFGKTYYVSDSAEQYDETGKASWYGPGFHGKLTSTREPYDMYAMTAAHKTLPLPCFVEVTNLENGRQIIVRVNDRGPFVDGRIIDLSYTAARQLDMVEAGTAEVRVRALTSPTRAGERIAKSPVTQSAMESTSLAAHFYIQVGAFAKRANAAAMQTRLAAATRLPVVLRSSDHQGRMMHRVQIGPLERRHNLEQVQDQLKQLGIVETRIIRGS